MMNVRPVRNEADYEWALSEVSSYFDYPPPVGSKDADRFDVLSDLIAAYEDRVWPIDAPEPISAIRHWMEIHDYSQADLASLLGSRSRASELLNRRRPLNMTMAIRLHDAWKIPAELLLRPMPDTLAA
jgi:HTH-type transcriptional regulator / antitoxin HigA